MVGMNVRNDDFVNPSRINTQFLHVGQQRCAVASRIEQHCRSLCCDDCGEAPARLKPRIDDMVVKDGRNDDLAAAGGWHDGLLWLSRFGWHGRDSDREKRAHDALKHSALSPAGY
jgi:hypothetical protein